METLVLPGSHRHSAVSCKPFLGNFLENQAGEPPGDRNLSDQASPGREGLLPTTDRSCGQSAELMQFNVYKGSNIFVCSRRLVVVAGMLKYFVVVFATRQIIIQFKCFSN